MAAKIPGTPSRKEASGGSSSGHARERAVQDPGLKDFRLGDCIGKGAFGSVYKAFNWGTGEAVAVKQIKLADLPKSELRMIEVQIYIYPIVWLRLWRLVEEQRKVGKVLTALTGGNRPPQESSCMDCWP